MLRRILAPLDGSAFAEQALPVAGAIARRSGAALTLVRVHHPLLYGDLIAVPRWEEEEHRSEETYLHRMAARIEECFSVRVGTALLEGPVAEAICQFVRDHDFDLVVMSTHGRTGLSRAWLGSVADGVVRHMTRPVLLVRTVDRPSTVELEDDRDRVFERILVPLDGSPKAESILPHVANLASAFGSRILLLRLVEPIVIESSDYMLEYPIHSRATDDAATERVVQSATEYLESIRRRLRAEYGLETSADVRVVERLGPAIPKFASECDADLVALATHGRGASRLIMGSVADKVIRAGPGAILIQRSMDAAEQSAMTIAAAAAGAE